MAKYTLIEAVHVSITLDGQAIDLDLTAGDVELDQPIADLLVAQGLATEAAAKGSKSPKTLVADPVAETSTTTTEE